MNLASDNLKPPAAPQVVLTKTQETKLLQELVRIYQNCPERVAVYTRSKWIALLISYSLIFTGLLLSRFQNISSFLSCTVVLLGGVSLGLAIYFSSSAKQLPLFVRFTSLSEAEVRNRSKELA
jgi:uncharacterized membrane protein